MEEVSNEYYCNVCGKVDETYSEESTSQHVNSVKHKCNSKLHEYHLKRKRFHKNKDGISITCSAQSEPLNGECGTTQEPTTHHKIIIFVKPKQRVKFSFIIKNESKNKYTLLGIQLAHPQPLFVMNSHPFVFGDNPHILKPQSTIEQEVSVKFEAIDIGQYEMPVMFTFENKNNEDKIFIRQIVVMMQDIPSGKYIKSPYSNKAWERASLLIPSTNGPNQSAFKIPSDVKIVLAIGLNEDNLEKLHIEEDKRMKLRTKIIEIKSIIKEGITKENYVKFFQHLLWWEEVIIKINLKRYNMVGVTIEKKNGVYLLEVPGLAEKRPSVLRGDRILIRLTGDRDTIYECVVKHIDDSFVHLSEMDPSFEEVYGADVQFDVRFLLSRVPQERAHGALAGGLARHAARLFPSRDPARPKIIARPIKKFYNKFIEKNAEQKSAVEHIVSGTSGTVPYIVFGPPGTGKTMTIVEAIIQIVVQNPMSRVLVCTDSNMAADHIALMILQYNNQLNINNFIFRASSQMREWSVLPPALAPVSNGTCFKTFYSVKNEQLATYRIVVTTLLHSAKFATKFNQQKYKVEMSHLFIDEAAQAMEPASLIPACGLLAAGGALVLAGDPHQLGPVCMSRTAKKMGLGQSLLERLIKTYGIYKSNPDYITMLVNNFRSDPDIIRLPNQLFYQNKLVALAPHDPLSRKSIIGLRGGERAVVFHGVHSREQSMKNAPSFFNEKEIEMIQRYVKGLINDHDVLPEDIGIVTPYIRQMYKIKAWLKSEKYDKVEIGTVEAFQGKEKRVILVSTVRANCRLLEYDAKYDLGFLVDDKRFNVTVTRAKAKLIVIGNPTCLTRDEKWRLYMKFCKELGTYHGKETEQLERTSSLLVDISQTRFERCHLSKALEEIISEPKKGKQREANLA